ncbi:MAG: prefoldin subunit alpha [Nanoarchaeota archaeon]
MSDDELQEKYMQLQMMNKQIQELQQQMEMFGQQGQEIRNIVNGLEDFKDVKEGTSILIPLSSGIFARAKLENNKKLLMNVGNGVIVDKSIDEAKKLLLEQIEKVNRLEEHMTKEINNIANSAIPIQEELHRLIETEKKK